VPDEEQDMNGRVQRALDGELPFEALTSDEQADYEACHAAMGMALGSLSAEAAPDVSAAVMWRLQGLEPEPAPRAAIGRAADALRGAVSWLLTPQSVRLRPAAAFGVVALIAAAVLVFQPADSQVAAGPGELELLVQFRISADDARQVALVGTFSGWEGHALEEVSPGVWSTTLPLAPGMYDYAFVIDGERWQLDPLAPAVADGFGGANSRIAVMAPEMRGL
jgi:hypothetical protein